MEDKKIERLFQENLKDFEVQPPSLVWDTIESELTKKKKRRVLPIWWLSSGVASLVIIGLLLFPEIKNTDINTPVYQNETNKNIDNQNSIKTEKQIYKTPVTIVENVKNEDNTTKNTSNYIEPKDELMVSTKIENEEKKTATSTVSLKGLEVDKKIAMKNLLYESLHLKTKERELEKKNFIAEVTKELETKEDQPKNSKWSVSPVVGITTSESFTKASAIDSNFNENKVSNPETLAYGLSFTYQINDKLFIKSGLQVQNLSFNTQDVVLVSNTAMSNNLQNISFSNADNFLYFSASDSEDINSVGLTNSASLDDGVLEQDINYLEFPLELKYQLFTSEKIQTSLISGFSSLFLTQNSITARASNFSGKIGKANNLNSVNFSVNFGVDLEFMLSKKMRFNINPMFKSQLNTFSENSTNSKPYIIGVYSGVRFNF